MPKNNKFGCSYATQQKLAKSLKELMLQVPFEKLSVSDITANCNLHRQTFYYHFEDKYELLDYIVYNELINPFITGFKMENIYDKIYALFSTMLGEKKFYQNSLRIDTQELSRYVSKIAYDYVKPVIKSIKSDNSINNSDELNDAIVAEFFSYGISGVIICWVQRGMKDSPKSMTKRVEKIIENIKLLASAKNID